MSDTPYDPARHYDRVTPAWNLLLGDELHYGLFLTGDEDLASATRAMTARMAEVCRTEQDCTILDVGCGTGGPARYLASQFAANVTGITTSVVGVAEATARASAAGLADRTRFECRDGTDNGLPGAAFDRVWILESSHLMRGRDRLVAECARVLRPGGRLALCDIMLRRPMPFDEVRRLREPLRLLRDVFGDARMEPIDRYAELAKQHGLAVDVEEDLTEPTRPTFTRWRENAERHRHEVDDALGHGERQRFVQACDVLDAFWDDGTLGYGILGAGKPS